MPDHTNESLNKEESTPDQVAAHQFLSELRTRIATQPLPYQYGVEERALDGLREIFEQAREAMRDNPGCEEFATKVTRMLNNDLRPVTAKWHREASLGRLKSQDGALAFRRDLAKVQAELSKFAHELHEMAYHVSMPEEKTPPVLDPGTLDGYFAKLAYGIPQGVRVDEEQREKINAAERSAVEARRAGDTGESHASRALAASTPPEFHDAFGLAFSGGGIRSATFSLGVVQVLAERGFLREVDFLSTVSGGGYTGSFLTRRLGDGTEEKDLGTPYGPDPDAIRYVRQNAQYLAARNLKAKWAMVAGSLVGMVLNWMIPLLALVGIALIAVVTPWDAAWWAPLIRISATATGLSLLLYGWLMRGTPRVAGFGSAVLGGSLGATILLLLVQALGLGHDHLPAFFEWLDQHRGKAFTLAGLLAAGPNIIRFVPVLKEPKVRKLDLQVLLILAGIVIPFGLLCGFYGLWFFGERQHGLPNGGVIHGWLALCIGAGVLIVLDFILNINLTAPHRMYRDALAKTFIISDPGKPGPVELAKINEKGRAPYHLLNASLNLPSTQHPAVHDRLCDFFLFSKAYTGSPSVGYHLTEKWQANGGPIDLATAMAVSGAAFSSHMGLGSMPTLTALLAFFNVRLGFWISRPGSSGFQYPGFWCLLREMFKFGMSEKDKWLNLSDGGHIENMAVYELLRRRCKFIICVDGEADPGFEFPGLMTLVRHAQIDLGVRIDPQLAGLRPDPETTFSRTHYHFCPIYYPALGSTKAGHGFLLYLKLSMTGNETELIKKYREKNADFPHQTTLDQFFDQEQFEAYRELGVHVADGVFTPPFWTDAETASKVHTWFRALAANLLPPEP